MELDSMLDHEGQDDNAKRLNITTDSVKSKTKSILARRQQQTLSESWKKSLLGTSINGKLCSSMLFLLIISVGIISFISYREVKKNHEPFTENQVDITSEDFELNDDSNINDEGQSHIRMKSGSYFDSSPFGRPRYLGQMKVYIRKPTHDRIRQPPTPTKFPVASYSRGRFPRANNFYSFMPKTGIFVDFSTQQTIIYSGSGVYILPPIINIYGELFSVAQLISLGYASFVSTGKPPMGPVDMTSYFYPQPLMGPGIPRFSYSRGAFIGGVRVPYSSFFMPKYRFSDINSYQYESKGRYYEKPKNSPYKPPSKPSKNYTKTYISPKPRAMLKVHANSTVGVLLDHIPANARAKAYSLLNQKKDDFWRRLATQQIQYTQVRLIFRPLTYPDVVEPSRRGPLSLTLPKFFKFEFTSKPYFTTIDGHSLYVRNYTFHNVLVSDVESVVKCDDRLAEVGGIMIENYTLPIDPFLILQRTGYACIGELQWPPRSVDPETVDIFYDDTCLAEEPQDPSLIGCHQCHCSYPLPELSCIDAVKKYIGHMPVDLVFERIADNPTLANEWRYPVDGPSVNALGEVAPVNLFEIVESMADTRVVYLYIEPDGCEIEEQCVGDYGWRRLMLFSTQTANFGIEELNVGEVSYFGSETPTDAVTKHRIFEFSACHKHFHYSHYAQFVFGTKIVITNTKHGFCLQTTYRYANAEWSVLTQDHYTCSNQGISPGWSDTYQGGITCQWIDVSGLDTTVRPYTDELSSILNPDDFICEGTPIPDTWLETNFTTTCCSGSDCCGDTDLTKCCGNLPVERPACKQWPGYNKDNKATVMVTIPKDGEGQVTADCAATSGNWGEQRDCGFRIHPRGKMLDCGNPGDNAVLKSVTASTFFQVVRVCEASLVLNQCLACIWNSSLVTTTIEQGKPQDIEFTCTPARDERETGGKFCIYVAPLFEEMDHNANFIKWSSIA